MMRVIKLKSSLLRRLVGDGDVGINIGGGVIGGDCAGAKEPLPGMPLYGDTGVACPLDVAVGFGCEGGRRGLFTVEYVGVEDPELLPIDTGGMLCPPLEDGENDEPDWVIKVGDGAEVFTTGRAGEDGVFPGVRSGEMGMTYVGIYSASIGNAGLPSLSGTGTFRASAIAAASDEAPGKRAAESFARQRKMTISSAGGMFGLMSKGEGGVVLRCWDITAVGLSP